MANSQVESQAQPTYADRAGDVTEARRRVILWVLWVHGAQNPSSMTKLLLTHIEQGNVKWLEAPWAGARQEPYPLGIRQHLDAMSSPDESGRVRKITAGNGHLLFEWNRKVLQPRRHAAHVLKLRGLGHSNGQIATVLGIGPQAVSALYHDPIGLSERERKVKYCGGCGQRKDPEQTICTGCVRRRRLEHEDRAESLLPDSSWVNGLRVLMPVDFAVTERMERVLIVHTERGRIERTLARSESWEHAVREAGVMR